MWKHAISIFILCLLPSLAWADTPLLLWAGWPVFAVLGLALLILELFLPTKGLLGIAGLAFFVYGTIGLADHPDPKLRASMSQIIAVNTIMISLFAVIIFATYKGYAGKKARDFDLSGSTAKVLDWQGDSGRVEVNGEIWQAKSSARLSPGQSVIISNQDHLTLHVTPEN